MRPFGDNALALHDLELTVFPCGGEDGKIPSVSHWQSRKSRKTITKWTRRFGDKNIGIACEPSGIVIVDPDLPELVDPMLERFGDTPLITRTPSGGAHLWYRASGLVTLEDLRNQGLDVDIQADGDMIIVPPSFNRQSGVPYVFARGSWDQLPHLPPFRHEALNARPRKNETKPRIGSITDGVRNKTLYRQLLRSAKQAAAFEDLLTAARRFNEGFAPPLRDAEVVKTAAGAWKCQIEGRNRVGTQGAVVWSVERVQTCAPHKHGGDAIILTTILRAKHAYREDFAVVARAMAARHVIAGWTEHRIRTALEAAVSLGLLDRVYMGGRGPGDPSLYRLPGVRLASPDPHGS